jgi:hypothetical protein
MKTVYLVGRPQKRWREDGTSVEYELLMFRNGVPEICVFWHVTPYHYVVSKDGEPIAR